MLRGRPRGQAPSIERGRSLERADLAAPKGREPAVKRFRESHHRVARLFAMGLRPFQVAEATGYTLVRISILRKDPAFQDLVARYAADVNDEWKQEVSGYYENLNKVRDITARMMLDQLVDADEVGEILPLRQLAGIHSDAADRTGFG